MKISNTSQFREALAQFPRLGIARLPTPLESVNRLSEHLGGPRIWINRNHKRKALDK